MCAVFVSSFFCVIPLATGRIAFFLVSFFVSFARLVLRLVSILCGSPVVSYCSSIRSASRCLVSSGGPVPRLVYRSSVFRLARLIVPRLVPRLVRSSRQAVDVLSFRLAARGVGSCPCVSFFSVLVLSRSLRLMAMAAARHLWSRFARLVVACFFLCCHLSSWGVAMAG